KKREYPSAIRSGTVPIRATTSRLRSISRGPPGVETSAVGSNCAYVDNTYGDASTFARYRANVWHSAKSDSDVCNSGGTGIRYGQHFGETPQWSRQRR